MCSPGAGYYCVVPMKKRQAREVSAYHGECDCTHAPCKNKAYWSVGTDVLCGVHSKRNMAIRVALPKNPDAKRVKAETVAARLAEAKVAQRANRAAGRRGHVIVSQQKMMKTPPFEPGYIAVFPNAKAGHAKARSDGGIGASALSPMKLGPVEHGQPGLPPAKNLENFHQGGKVFASEVDAHDNPLPIWYARRLAMYQDAEPHRHKLGHTRAEHVKAAGVSERPGNPNHCRYVIFVDKDGQERRYTYGECRRFYCNFYERLAKQTEDFGKLQAMLDAGWNIQIIGYDGFSMGKAGCSSITEAYADESVPFGHERVLYTLLVTSDDEPYPWPPLK